MEKAGIVYVKLLKCDVILTEKVSRFYETLNLAWGSWTGPWMMRTQTSLCCVTMPRHEAVKPSKFPITKGLQGKQWVRRMLKTKQNKRNSWKLVGWGCWKRGHRKLFRHAKEFSWKERRAYSRSVSGEKQVCELERPPVNREDEPEVGEDEGRKTGCWNGEGLHW